MELERQQKQSQKDSMAGIHRAEGGDPPESLFGNDLAPEPKKELFEFVEVEGCDFSSGTVFCSKYTPDLIEASLIRYIEKQGAKVDVNTKKYKYKFTLSSAEPGYDEKFETYMQVRLLSDVKNSLVRLEFQKLRGDQTAMNAHFNTFKKELLTGVNKKAVSFDEN